MVGPRPLRAPACDQGEERSEESGLRNGFRPRRVQTAEGELEIEIPQVRQAAETFASKLFPRTPKLLRTEPLKALVIGAFVRGLSMRDVESLCEQAGLGKLSKSTASRMCEELKERFEAFRRRDLYEIRLVALFLDATFIAVRPDGPKEGVQVAWGFSEEGERVLLSVSLGMRESFEDWQALGRDLIGRGLGAPMLIVADGAPGLVKAIEQCWPASDRQRCCVHRARNLYAKLPDRERERVKHAYWQALDDAISETDAKHRLQRWSTTSTRAASPPPLAASPTTSTRWWSTCATQSGTADDGDRRTCSSARSARSNAARR